MVYSEDVSAILRITHMELFVFIWETGITGKLIFA